MACGSSACKEKCECVMLVEMVLVKVRVGGNVITISGTIDIGFVAVGMDVDTYNNRNGKYH